MVLAEHGAEQALAQLRSSVAAAEQSQGLRGLLALQRFGRFNREANAVREGRRSLAVLVDGWGRAWLDRQTQAVKDEVRELSVRLSAVYAAAIQHGAGMMGDDPIHWEN